MSTTQCRAQSFWRFKIRTSTPPWFSILNVRKNYVINVFYRSWVNYTIKHTRARTRAHTHAHTQLSIYIFRQARAHTDKQTRTWNALLVLIMTVCFSVNVWYSITHVLKSEVLVFIKKVPKNGVTFCWLVNSYVGFSANYYIRTNVLE